MKPLDKNTLRTVREFEKLETTEEPKKIWFRAWELMVERNQEEKEKVK